MTTEHSGKQRPARAVTSPYDVISGKLEFDAVAPTHRQPTYVCVNDQTTTYHTADMFNGTTIALYAEQSGGSPLAWAACNCTSINQSINPI